MFHYIKANFNRLFGLDQVISENISFEMNNFQIADITSLEKEFSIFDHIPELIINTESEIHKFDKFPEHKEDIDNSIDGLRNLNSEKSHLYNGFLFTINDKYRLIVCKEGIQWILQKRKGYNNGRPEWRGISYLRSKVGVLRRVKEEVGKVSPEVEALLAALPDWVES